MKITNAINQKPQKQIHKPTIILMSKWHAINRCKSRLSREIGTVKASKIQEKLTNHTIAVAKQIQKDGLAEIKIAIGGIGNNAAKRWAKINKIRNFDTQGSGNLGTRMKRQFLKTYSENKTSPRFSKPIILIGTDLPTISRFDLTQAIEIIERKEMVLGPSTDGGYWLIGLSSELLEPICLWPFCGINWGTDQVLNETIQLASSNNIDYELLQTKNDIDSLIDLSPWIDHKKFQVSVSSYQL
tara:strand:- start:5372 stop:6097 length:726 start_codon:yes stop_codon:yes gene_type:complete